MGGCTSLSVSLCCAEFACVKRGPHRPLFDFARFTGLLILMAAYWNSSPVEKAKVTKEYLCSLCVGRKDRSERELINCFSTCPR